MCKFVFFVFFNLSPLPCLFDPPDETYDQFPWNFGLTFRSLKSYFQTFKPGIYYIDIGVNPYYALFVSTFFASI